MRFDLESGAPPVADIDDSGVLARRHDHALALRGQTLQVNARRFVGAMFRPHHRKDAQLDQSRLAAKQLPDAREFFLGKVVGGYYFGCNRFHY